MSQGLHPLQLLSLLSRAFRTMLAAKYAGNNLDSEIATPWFARKLGRDGGKFSEEDLEKAIGRLADLDMSLKNSSGSDETLLLGCINHLCLRQ